MAKKEKEQKKKKKKEEVVIEIEMENEDMAEENKDWTDEFVVAGNELADFVKNMLHEVGVRRILLKNEKHGIHYEIPMVVGLAGIIMMPAVLTMLGIIAALVTECSIIVVRAETEETAAGETAAA